MNDNQRVLGALVLAAGKGTRMRSNLPKVLHTLLDEPLIYYPLKALQDADIQNVAVVVGHGGEDVEAYLLSEWPNVEIVWQHDQLGTGDAVRTAETWWNRFDDLLVLSGDVPLIRPETIRSLLTKHKESCPACTFMSVILDDPTGYGRVVRLADGGVRIIEEKDVLFEEKNIQEINAGVYVFNSSALQKVIPYLKQNNKQKEYYLTDTIYLIAENVGLVDLELCEDQGELRGINSPDELAEAGIYMRNRILYDWMRQGVKCADIHSTWIGPKVRFEAGAWLESDVQIWGRSFIGADSRIGTHTKLRDVVFEGQVTIEGFTVASKCTLKGGSQIGPFVFLRDGVLIDEKVRVGRFVEIKKSHIAEGTKIPHLSYIGDAEIGARTNIGAGTITCNFDGAEKHRTSIGEDCFIGSDTMLVAPVNIGDYASTAAGSVITQDIPEGALGVARESQINIEGWSKQHYPKKKRESE